MISTSILLLNLASIVFFSSIPTDATQDNDDCISSYPDICKPSLLLNLNCGDISDKRFKVLLTDPHGLDYVGEGKGCES